jgi:hypothetical protein
MSHRFRATYFTLAPKETRFAFFAPRSIGTFDLSFFWMSFDLSFAAVAEPGKNLSLGEP